MEILENIASNIVEEEYGYLEYIRKNNLKESFIDFAKSEAVKEYWQKQFKQNNDLYTEDEVLILLENFVNNNLNNESR